MASPITERLASMQGPPPPCPFCHGQETRLHALFGSQLSTSQYYCAQCRVAFEHIKWDDADNQPDPQ